MVKFGPFSILTKEKSDFEVAKTYAEENFLCNLGEDWGYEFTGKFEAGGERSNRINNIIVEIDLLYFGKNQISDEVAKNVIKDCYSKFAEAASDRFLYSLLNGRVQLTSNIGVEPLKKHPARAIQPHA